MTWNRLRSWLNLSQKPHGKQRGWAVRRAQPALELLESRVVPAFAVGANVNISK